MVVRVVRKLLTQLTQLRFCTLQPIRDAHFAVHRRRDGEVLLSLTGIAHAVMHLAETQVAVSDKRTHAAGLGERQRLAVRTLSILGAGCDGDVTVEAEGTGLASPGSKPARECEGLSGVATRLVDPPDSETGHPRIQKSKRRPPVVNRAAAELLDGACDQPERLVSPTSERVGGAERCRRGVNCPDLPQVGVVEDPLENPRCTREMPAI